MSAQLNRYNPLRLLNSVPFGIVLMAVIAVYMAAGSGRQWLRSTGVDQWPIIRDWFDKTDLEFFNAWPLKTLMALLVANLIVVTWRKIPLTPPRYGVWCVHAGIITLVLGTSIHYGNKVEGRVRIYTDASGPTSVDNYYDKDERSLFIRTGRDIPASFPLPTLPRFQQYDAAAGNESTLRSRGLYDIAPTLTTVNHKDEPVLENMAEQVGVKGDLRLDVIGYYPYADVRTSFDGTDPASNVTGVELSMTDLADPEATRDWYVVASDPRFKTQVNEFSEVQHLDGDADVAAKVAEAAGQIFRLDVTGGDKPTSIPVHIGQDVPLGKAGYSAKIESFNPAWPMATTHEPVPALTLLMTTPTKQFRRMVLSGHPEATSDFRLGGANEPPVKMRSSKPMDTAVTLQFTFRDPFQLMPQERTVRHTVLTPSGSKELVDVEVAATGAATVHRFADGNGDISLVAPMSDDAASAGSAPPAEPDHPAIKVHLERHDHLDPQDTASPVPPSKRQAQMDEDGTRQAIRLRVRLGSWSKEIVVPFAPDAADRVRVDPWQGGFVMLPGAVAPLQFQLGNTRRPLPCRLTLDNFKVIPFDGGVDSPDSFIQDYRSTITMSGSDDSDTLTDVASLNHPIYFDGGRWLFFQAAYDPSVPHAWTELGVGNRPAVPIMITGCVMIFVGLMYAFYAKPIIIRRMKQRALDAAVAAGRMKAVADERPTELVGS